MKVKGVIFDLDGTLLDSMHIWHDVDKLFLAECGVEAPPDLAENIKMMTIDMCVEYFRKSLGVSLSADMVKKRCAELMADFYTTRVQAKPHAGELLRHLKKLGIKMCVATANDPVLAANALANVGFAEYFEFVLTCGEADAPKTDGKIYRICAERLGVHPSEAIVMEDAMHGIISANGEGFMTVGVFDESFESEADKIREICDIYAEDFASLLDSRVFERLLKGGGAA